jgi:hypothetical protein
MQVPHGIIARRQVRKSGNERSSSLVRPYQGGRPSVRFAVSEIRVIPQREQGRPSIPPEVKAQCICFLFGSADLTDRVSRTILKVSGKLWICVSFSHHEMAQLSITAPIDIRIDHSTGSASKVLEGLTFTTLEHIQHRQILTGSPDPRLSVILEVNDAVITMNLIRSRHRLSFPFMPDHAAIMSSETCSASLRWGRKAIRSRRDL